MRHSVLHSRLWYFALVLVAGWICVCSTQVALMAQDDASGFVVKDNGANGDTLAKDPDANLPETFLGWMIRASGIFGFLIMLVSFAMVAIIMTIALQLRRDNYLPAAFIDEFEQQLQAEDYRGAYESAKSSDSFIGRILAAGMSRLHRGYDEAVEQMQQVGDDESMAMEHKIGYLALIGSIAPMLGLLGTVQGMVISFQVIASSATSPKPSKLADGIATALFTTLEGLCVAIPAIVFYSLYKNRLARFLLESGFVADNLMKNFRDVAKPTGTSARSAAVASAGSASSSKFE